MKEYYTEDQKAVLDVFHGKFQTDDNSRTMEFLEVYDIHRKFQFQACLKMAMMIKYLGR